MIANVAAAGQGLGAPTRNLILVRQVGWQAIEDWHEIAGYVKEIDPSVEPFVVEATIPSSVTRRVAARRPTLVFSPGPLGAFRPLRGKVYHGRPLAKMEQTRRLAAGGVPVPRTVLLTPNLTLDPAEWGDMVVVSQAILVRHPSVAASS